MAEERWVPITIEKHSDFWYQCGRLGHVMKDCEEDDSEEKEEGNQYGPWLRESTLRGKRLSSKKRMRAIGRKKKTRRK